jgi:bifunctional non-homologous end joining protein LigD
MRSGTVGYAVDVTPFPQPALARLTHDPFFEQGWLYERKLDGVRCLAENSGGQVRLWSRNGRDVSRGFPELVEALEGQRASEFVVDGEIVAFDGTRTSFAALQPRIHVSDPDRARRTGVMVFLYLFDVLKADGDDVRQAALRARKALLRDLLTFRDPLRFTQHRVRAAEEYFADICHRGWEGLIAKRADSAYVPGRSDNWLKFKCEAGQEFVIGGYTDPEGSRTGFGALLLGYFDGDDLVYAGKVGTGFSDEVLDSLLERMKGLHRRTPPFGRGHLPSKGVHWLRPELVCQVAFTEWTRAGQLRHPRYLGLRHDKAPSAVVRE